MTMAAGAQTGAQQAQQRPWWATLIIGIAGIVLGAIMLWAAPQTKVETYRLLIALVGLWWVVTGVLDLVHMFQDHTQWGWKLFMGVVSLLAGGWILMYPVAAGLALPSIFVLVIGIWALMYGVMMLVLAFRGGGWAAGILGVIELILGFILIGNYASFGSGLALVWSASIIAFVGGIFLIIAAFRQRSA